MIDVFGGAVELQDFCQMRAWRFCFIGALALQRWGDPRFTVDADLTLLTGFGSEERFVAELLENFAPRTETEREDAPKRRVLLLYSSSGVGLDVALGALPFEERSVERASPWQFGSGPASLTTCSAEDLIVHKAFASRDLDWADVESIVMRQGRKLNLDQIWTELRPLVELKEAPEILTKLQKIFDEQLD